MGFNNRELIIEVLILLLYIRLQRVIITGLTKFYQACDNFLSWA